MTAKPFQFESALKELEAITTWFESSDVNLDQGLEKFERGMELTSQLKEHLATVENRVEKIKARFAVVENDISSDIDTNDGPIDLFS